LLTVAGLQVPVTPFVDVVGREGTAPPAHMVRLEPNAKVGATFGSTVTVNEVGNAHNPAVGVNVYVPELRLSTVAGLHVPVIPLVDVVGKPGTAVPEHTVVLVPKLNTGVIFGFTVTVNVAGTAHNPAVGVKV
jgi:hypothetical protein